MLRIRQRAAWLKVELSFEFKRFPRFPAKKGRSIVFEAAWGWGGEAGQDGGLCVCPVCAWALEHARVWTRTRVRCSQNPYDGTEGLMRGVRLPWAWVLAPRPGRQSQGGRTEATASCQGADWRAIRRHKGGRCESFLQPREQAEENSRESWLLCIRDGPRNQWGLHSAGDWHARACAHVENRHCGRPHGRLGLSRGGGGRLWGHVRKSLLGWQRQVFLHTRHLPLPSYQNFSNLASQSLCQMWWRTNFLGHESGKEMWSEWEGVSQHAFHSCRN